MEVITGFLDYTLFEYQGFKLTVFGLFSILLVFVLARLSLWILQATLNRSFSKRTLGDPGRRHALIQIVKYVIYTIAVIFALQSIGMNLSILMAGSAALLVGIGFGLQNTFNDFVSGIIILFDGSIEVNDVIQVEDLVGRIKHIGIRATTVYTRDGISVIVPNSKFTQENIINWSHNDEVARFNVTVGVAYGSDVDKVIETLKNCIKDHPKIEQNPVPQVRFIDFGDSALIFEVLFWTSDTFMVEFTKSDLRVAIDRAFRQEDIHIPFPQRDLHIISDRRQMPLSA
jgi:small-conductance mechanosensitive channel